MSNHICEECLATGEWRKFTKDFRREFFLCPECLKKLEDLGEVIYESI